MSWRSVIGLFAGRSFGSPLVSNPSSTCGEARSGSSLRRDRLCHRGNPEHAVGRHQIVLGQVTLAERAFINHVRVVRRQRDNTGNFHGVAFLAQDLVDLGFALHGVPPEIFVLRPRSSSRDFLAARVHG
jgi:hypothetical protein